MDIAKTGFRTKAWHEINTGESGPVILVTQEVDTCPTPTHIVTLEREEALALRELIDKVFPPETDAELDAYLDRLEEKNKKLPAAPSAEVIDRLKAGQAKGYVCKTNHGGGSPELEHRGRPEDVG